MLEPSNFKIGIKARQKRSCSRESFRKMPQEILTFPALRDSLTLFKVSVVLHDLILISMKFPKEGIILYISRRF